MWVIGKNEAAGATVQTEEAMEQGEKERFPGYFHEQDVFQAPMGLPYHLKFFPSLSP